MTNLSGSNLNRREATGPKGEGRDSPSTFPRYPEYKDSGVEWLGEVPAHWEVPRLKHLTRIRNGRDYKDVEVETGGYPVIGSGGEFSRANSYLYKGESVLLGRKGTIDKPLYINGPFWTVDTMFYTELSSRVDGRFLFYYATCFRFDQYSTNTALPSMAQEDLANIQLATPEPDEQAHIATFLDYETTRIDALVEEQQRLIELLKEKRLAVISHAVTKGLDPDVSMKDSGVEWLGEVPEHWELGGLTKFIGPVVDYRGRTPKKVDDGVFLVTAKNVRNGRIDYEVSREYADAESARSLLERGRPEIGDLLFTMEAPLGQVALIDRTDIALAQRIVKFRGVEGVMMNTYLMYWLMSTGCQARMETLATGSTALGIKASKLGMIECLVPPITEQEEIVSLIERESAKHDVLLAEAQTNIDLLQERRSALISAAVTGKIDVRGWTPPAGSASTQQEAHLEAV
ncbi:restriction endonuclease subunit S [Halomonas sp. PR-M31]|uniref:restriction endonuclease subunit S n=1 Tax=Halomonas sp. PR-M31 TaxID=1471202 RepID=UPI00069DA5D3|nr:restriction endonuclease subunit S [Halomonas sp. PR-M31]